ncbi:MAG TPA: glycosyltransferase family 4 protein [Thermoplasmata archaeon]|nr:glycosyltransferase family 4 protein [Thermoplasmata archaeon]
MKIAQVTLRFDAPGGVETNVREVSRRLQDAGHQVTVFASDLYDESTRERRPDYAPVVDGVPVRRFSVRHKLIPGLTLPMMVGLMDALADSGVDIIHAHSHRYGHVLESAAVADRLGIPLVVSTHYHPADRSEPPIKAALLRLQDFGFGMTAYRAAEALVVETELEARLVREFAPAAKIRIIPPGLDLQEWQNAPGDRPSAVPLPAKYLLFAGRVASNKGVPLLLDALARIPPADRLPLVLMGKDWGQRAMLEAQAHRLGIASSLTWLGHVPDRAQYRAVVRGATALVLPSEWEAFGIVLLEGMAAGTPVVATAVGGVPEVMEHGRAGRLVPYDDPDALGAALVAVVREPEETRRLAARGAEVVTRLDWSECARQHEELYRSLLGR